VAPSSAQPAPQAGGLDTKERVRLMRDGVVNYAGFVANGLAGIILVPVMLRCLGTESYGLWLAALATYGMLSSFDFGLHWSVTREISAALNAGPSENTTGFVLAAGNLYLLLGITGAVLIATLGLPISAGLHLSVQSKKIAPELFLLVAAIFVADRLVLFTTAALSGLRRFGVINAISAGAAFLRLMGSLALLWTGRSILAIAFWNLVVSALWAWVALQWVSSVEPRFRFQLGRFRWRLVRPHLSFSILSFLTAVAVKIIWDMAPFVIGFFQGSVFIVPYSIGVRFPIALNHVNSRAAETFFPAASERMTANDSAGSRGILQLGTRWILVMALPPCIMLCIAAPNLLHAWVGTSMPDAASILRIACIAVLAQAFGMGAMQVLWGRGAARTIFAVLGILAIPSLALTVGLVRALGDVGAALALCISLYSSGGVFVFLTARVCQVRLMELLAETFRGLLLPNAVCTVCTYALVRLTKPQHWMGVIGSCLVGGATYVAVLYFSGARDEEKQFVRQALGLQPAPLGRAV
jgi:O-antigen/teichoic acid export membrane protein